MGNERRVEPSLETVIDCNECVMQGTDACSDCVVSYVLDRPEGAVIFDADEERAVCSRTFGASASRPGGTRRMRRASRRLLRSRSSLRAKYSDFFAPESPRLKWPGWPVWTSNGSSASIRRSCTNGAG